MNNFALNEINFAIYEKQNTTRDISIKTCQKIMIIYLNVKTS